MLDVSVNPCLLKGFGVKQFEVIPPDTIKEGEIIAMFQEYPPRSTDPEEEEWKSDDIPDDEGLCQYGAPKVLVEYFTNNSSLISWNIVDGLLRGTWYRNGRGKLRQIERLNFLSHIAATPAQKLEILGILVSQQLSIQPGNRIPIYIWDKCVSNMFLMLDILAHYPNIVLNGDKESLGICESKKDAYYKGKISVVGDLAQLFYRTNCEFYKILQFTDHHSPAYSKMLHSETLLYALSESVRKRLSVPEEIANVALRQMQLVYYKTREEYDVMRKQLLKQQREKGTCQEHCGPLPVIVIPKIVPQRLTLPENFTTVMDELLSIINMCGDEKIKTVATIFHIYHLAITDHFSESRQVLLQKKLREKASSMDLHTQTLFNRAKAQVGLSAFRAALIEDAHSYLSELFAGGSSVEVLLAQGVPRSSLHVKTCKQEVSERRKLLVYHMHIDLELLEAVYLVCATLVEVSNMDFRRLLAVSESESSTAAPNNIRGFVMAAICARREGDFEKCFNSIKSLDFWRLLEDSDSILGMLMDKIEEVAFRKM